mmetsp:Transcript_20320/g.30035  ORF Transcript_20320/g.30035 Transcript_20320/m.30035 type:complete len:283 (+) Transcript_20320:14-862(+)
METLPKLSEDAPSLLVIILDSSASSFNSKACRVTLQETVESLLFFVQGYLMMHRRNDLAFLTYNETGSVFLYPTSRLERDNLSLANGAVSVKFMTKCVAEGLESFLTAESSISPSNTFSVSKALSQSLCFVNRKMKEIKNVQTRILMVRASRDQPESYNAIMNSIFSAQKAQVPLDCLCVGPESIFMQQATDVTGGIYHQTDERNVLQVLLSQFLPSQSTRKFLKQKGQESVDFRAACFCHRKLIEIAFVCSVCLSLFCSFHDQCPTCGTMSSFQIKKTSEP